MFPTLTTADDARRFRNKVIQIILVFVAVPHVKMWRCAPSNETVVSSVVLCIGWTASLLQTYTKKEKKKERKKENLTKKDEPLVSLQQKVCRLQTNSVSFVKHCCFIALWQHPALTMKTRWWNVKRCFCWGNQQDPEQHTQMHSFQKHCEILDMTEWKHAILPSKHLDWQIMFFFILGHLLHLPS